MNNLEDPYYKVAYEWLKPEDESLLNVVRKSFKDYKHSECAREFVRFWRDEKVPASRREMHSKNYANVINGMFPGYFSNASDVEPSDLPSVISFACMFKMFCSENGFDCDGAGGYTPQETVALYGALWQNLVKVHEVEQKRLYHPWHKYKFSFEESFLGDISGDTMNSFGSQFQEVLACECFSDAALLYRESMRVKDRSGASNSLPNIQLAVFSRLTHTAGNFIPIPKSGIPGQRNTSVQHMHRWFSERFDKFLYAIYCWVMEMDSVPQDEELKKSEKTVNRIKELLNSKEEGREDNHLSQWICCFSNPEEKDSQKIWDAFIKGNYLQDYVIIIDSETETETETYGQPILYDEKISERLRQMNARIIARGKRMRTALEDMSEDDLKELLGDGGIIEMVKRQPDLKQLLEEGVVDKKAALIKYIFEPATI